MIKDLVEICLRNRFRLKTLDLFQAACKELLSYQNYGILIAIKKLNDVGNAQLRLEQVLREEQLVYLECRSRLF